MTPELINLRTAPDHELLPLHEFWLARRAELLPEDPPIPWSERSKGWREPPATLERRVYILKNQNEVIGSADADWRNDDMENPDSGWVDVYVHPAHFKKGLGTKLLLALLEDIVLLGRKKLFAATSSVQTGGQPFAESIGAKFGQEEHTNQLLFNEMNRAYLQDSLENAPTDLYELVWYDCDYPDDDSELQKICEIEQVMNTAPRGDLEFNDWKMTPKKLREEAEEAKKYDRQWWMCLARNLKTGNYDGFTQTGWHPNRPKIVTQYGTGVHPKARGHGLGAWLKAAMIEKILRERPTVDRIRTGNADSNIPMLRINHALGFKPYLDRTEWQLEVEKTLEILRSKLSLSTSTKCFRVKL
jgi:mycothiol synthase